MIMIKDTVLLGMFVFVWVIACILRGFVRRWRELTREKSDALEDVAAAARQIRIQYVDHDAEVPTVVCYMTLEEWETLRLAFLRLEKALIEGSRDK